MSAPAVASELRERVLVRGLVARWHVVGLTAVLGAAAFLDLWRLDQNGYANTYYAGAIKSMTTSWHNFFFASFDPGGLVSVDKPPLALWLEAASARLFGYSGFTVLLPEALAGVAAVGVLYLLVSRYFGRVAGLVAALALAVSPVSVAVNRDNNPDALFALLLVVAVYLGARAAESGRLRWLLGAAVAVGLAFNTKMLASAIVLPGLAAAYLVFAPRSWRVRVGHLAAATALLLVVGGAWIAAVELTPAVDRPYVGSTSNNSALGLALDYNGLGRITGQTGGTSFGGGGIGGAFSGAPGVLRLFNDALGDQGGWLIPLAVIGAASLVAGAVRRRRRVEAAALTAIGGWFVAAAVIFSYAGGIIHTYYLSALAPATCALVGAGAVSLWRDARRGGVWVLFPLAAVAGTAWLELVLLRRSGYLSWLQVLMLALAAGAALTVAALAVRGLGTTRSRARAAGAASAAMLAAFLAAPTAWSATTLTAAVNGVFPGAGPSFVSGLSTSTVRAGGFGGRPTFRGGPGFGPPPGTGTFVRPRFGAFPRGGFRGTFRGGFDGGTSTETTAALQYVKTHGAAKRFGLIVSSEQAAAPYVIKGESVAAMGGFTGRETVLTRSYLARLVGSGDARYFLLGGGGGGGPGGFGARSNEAVTTITSACKQVTGWSGAGSGNATLYDCAGRSTAILNAA